MIREKKLRHALTVATGILLFLTVVGTILSLYLHLFNTDKLSAFSNEISKYSGTRIQLRFFKDNAQTAAFVIIGVLVFLAMAAVAVVTSLKHFKISQITLPERRGALQIIRIFTGFSLLAIPVLFMLFSMYGFELGKFQGGSNMWAMIFAIPASLYFLFPGITDRFSEFLQIVFGLFLIGFTVFSLVTTHVYMYEGLTSPIRACNLLSLVALMLFILYEIRFFASKPMPGVYLAFAGLTLYFCATNGIPRLIATIVGDMEVSLQTIYACFETMAATYAACRLILFLSEWKYTLQTASDIEEDLPDTVSLGEAHEGNDAVEPDYTEDSEIESPILAAAIDLDLYDQAFSGAIETEEDALDSISAPEAPSNEETDALSDDHLADLLQTVIDEIPEPVEEGTTTFENIPEESPESETAPDETPNAEDAFDALTSEMFGKE